MKTKNVSPVVDYCIEDRKKTRVFCQRLKWGVEHNIDPAAIAKHITWYWENVLETHFLKAEMLLAPKPKTVSFDTGREQRVRIRSLITAIQVRPMKMHILELAKALPDYFNFEIATGVPMVLGAMDEKAYNNLLSEINQIPRPHYAAAYPVPYWQHTRPRARFKAAAHVQIKPLFLRTGARN